MAAAFTPRAFAVLEGFAGSLGLPLRPAADGSVGFAFARQGQLQFTPALDSQREGARVLVSLARRPPRLDDQTAERALGLARLDPTTGRIIHAGLSPDGSIVFALGLEDGEFDLPAIEASIRMLSTCQDMAGA